MGLKSEQSDHRMAASQCPSHRTSGSLSTSRAECIHTHTHTIQIYTCTYTYIHTDPYIHTYIHTYRTSEHRSECEQLASSSAGGGSWREWPVPQHQQSQGTAYLCLSQPRLQGRSGPLRVVIDLKLLVYHFHPCLGILHAPVKVLLGLLCHRTCEGWEGHMRSGVRGYRESPGSRHSISTLNPTPPP